LENQTFELARTCEARILHFVAVPVSELRTPDGDGQENYTVSY
jgi:hypothetical protein